MSRVPFDFTLRVSSEPPQHERALLPFLIYYISAYGLKRLIHLRSKGKLVINAELGKGGIVTVFTGRIKILWSTSPARQGMQMWGGRRQESALPLQLYC